MKYFTFIFLLLVLTACRKEITTPKLSFSTSERNWFTYKDRQTLKFKNVSGDSIIYSVVNIRNDFKPEYKNALTNPIQIGFSEFYYVELKSLTDSIFIYFYKEFQFGDPNKMKQTIRWNKVTGQFVELKAIKDLSPFVSKTINNVLYDKVTEAIPVSQTLYPQTIWKSANYDQTFGFVELIDINNISWFRQ